MVTRITAFTAHQTAEGMRVTYTYSKIDADGRLLESNTRSTVIVLDSAINAAITDINDWLLGKIPQ